MMALWETNQNRRKDEKKENAYNTRYSQAVTHPSTDRARRLLNFGDRTKNRCFQRDMVVGNRWSLTSVQIFSATH